MQKNLPGGNAHLKSSLRLHDIAYLGAHNSPMAGCYGWSYIQQNVTITQQFEIYGARHFKIPLHWHVQNGVPQIVIGHEEDGKSNCKISLVTRVAKKPEKAVDRLKELVDLAFKYPDEVIIMKLESKLLENSKENGTLGWSQDEVAKKLHNLLVEIKAKQRVIRFQESNVPTLGWCRDNQKNIMITIEPREQIQGDLLGYTHFSYDVSDQVDWQTDPAKDVTDGKVRRGKNKNGYISAPFLEIHLNPENSFKPDILYRNKYNHYDHVKKRFLQYYKHCEKMPNFIVADFVDQGDLSKIIDEINKNINQNDCFKPELL